MVVALARIHAVPLLLTLLLAGASLCEALPARGLRLWNDRWAVAAASQLGSALSAVLSLAAPARRCWHQLSNENESTALLWN